jgi:solute:Na+ symporter, SSS family
MSVLDWIVMLATLVFISIYGMWKTRRESRNMESYVRGNTLPWYTVGLSIMATQASAITFLSAPGQAYVDGMRFLQFYFGLPLAMVVLSITVVPIFHRLKVYTAYEYLETRFDLKTRSLAAFLFLIQRGLAAGFTIYAPSLILSSILGWNIYITNVFIGSIVITYTVFGGTKAVSYTQLGQMTVILSGMIIAGILLVNLISMNVSFTDAVNVAGKMGKLNVIDLDFDLSNRYNIWSGLIGGFFLALSYFGTDQSQVARYLTGKSVAQSRLGLMLNGVVKIPMQFLILFVGALLFVFYQFEQPPIFFNKVEIQRVYQSEHADEFRQVEERFNQISSEKKEQVSQMVVAINSGDEETARAIQERVIVLDTTAAGLKKEAVDIMKVNYPLADTNDTNYIFLSFVTTYLPIGVIGLLIAVILAASMSSTSSELNALASTTIVDVYKRSVKKGQNEKHYVNASKWATVLWGVYAIGVAGFANQLGSLIEAVNILGSLFYGTILGIFLVAFYFKTIKGSTTFYAAIIAEILVILFYVYDLTAFLWLNLIGCVLVIGFSFLIDPFMKKHSSN